jgi:hypothetical protein
MNKIVLFILLLIYINCVIATNIDSVISVIHGTTTTEIYAFNNKNKGVLISHFDKIINTAVDDPMSCESIAYGIENNIVYVINTNACKSSENIVQKTIYFDRLHSVISQTFINNTLANFHKKVVVLYDPTTKIFTFIPMFEECKNPLRVHLDASKYGANLGSTFLPLPNQDAYIKYTDSKGKDHSKTIHIDYPKLFADCKG